MRFAAGKKHLPANRPCVPPTVHAKIHLRCPVRVPEPDRSRPQIQSRIALSGDNPNMDRRPRRADLRLGGLGLDDGTVGRGAAPDGRC